MNDANTILMESIREQFGGVIETATAASSVVAAFLAALVANESDGKNDAIRFEPTVFEHLKEVLLGQRPHYAPAGVKRAIAKSDLLIYCSPGATDGTRADFDLELQTLHNLATSWGLTQIMGWHLVEFSSGMGVGWLGTPSGNLTFATRLLAWFAEHYQLDLANDFEPLFRCWNTGEPTGQTYDPQYVQNGLARMTAWQELPETT